MMPPGGGGIYFEEEWLAHSSEDGVIRAAFLPSNARGADRPASTAKPTPFSNAG